MEKVFYFIRGAAKVFDFTRSTRSGVALKYDPTQKGYDPDRLDRESLESDWIAIGNDFKKVFCDYEAQYSKN